MPPKQDPAQPLSPALLRRRFDPKKVPFETSDQAAQCMEPVVGQARAKEALQFGLAIRDMGYHVFVDGPRRTGKTHLVRSFVEKLAAELPPPPDWVYVHNFRQPDRPRALRLPSGGGRTFAKEMAELVEGLTDKIPALFESEEYARRKEALAADFKVKRTEVFSKLDEMARGEGYVLRFEPTGIMVAPADDEGKPLPESVIRQLDEAEREDLRAKSDRIQAKVTESLRQVTALEKELNQAQSRVDEEMVLASAGHLFDELCDRYPNQREVLVFLEQVREDVCSNYQRFIAQKSPPQMQMIMGRQEDDLREYKVNVFVDNSETQGAPVIVEGHPTHPNLFGRIERQAQFGALVTDFTLLRPGSLHQANGGFLVLPVWDLLRMWLPWEALKRALRERQVAMEDAMEQLGYMVTRTLRPEPIPLDLKVILVGPSELYYLLQAHEPQFSKLFKVRAQMSSRMDWGGQEVDGFISHLCHLAREKELLPLHRSAVARLVEMAAELAGDRERLTLQLADVEDVVRESHYFARQAGAESIQASHVEEALDKRRYRVSMIEERLREAVTRGFIQVETGGAQVGQINGLAVLDLGDHAFGQAGRITATHGLGGEGVVAIDRECKLSGPIHDKGVLILGGFLTDRFAARGPLTLTANLVFEQSYGPIDGDSASLAELLVLLSRLSGVPLRQDLAVTGSVSQRGQVQAIGGVNWKIEGFFRLCQAQGLSGGQGVVIPKSNLANLMLPSPVVDAVKKGKFSVYAVETVEEALEIFTGRKAGRLKKDGAYTAGSVFALVEKELLRLRQLARKEKAGGNKRPRRKRRGI